MDYYLLSILELTVNINEYLRIEKNNKCHNMDSLRMSTFHTLNTGTINISGGKMDNLYHYIKNNGIPCMKFFCDPQLKFYLTHCADWGIIGFEKPMKDICRTWRFAFQQIDIINFQPFSQEQKETASKCHVFEKDEFDDFKDTLESITRIAHSLGFLGFEAEFQQSLDILNKKIDYNGILEKPHTAVFRLPSHYGSEAQRKLCAIGRLFVFHGKGYWADYPLATAYPETQLLFTYGLSVLAHIVNFGGKY